MFMLGFRGYAWPQGKERQSSQYSIWYCGDIKLFMIILSIFMMYYFIKAKWTSWQDFMPGQQTLEETAVKQKPPHYKTNKRQIHALLGTCCYESHLNWLTWTVETPLAKTLLEDFHIKYSFLHMVCHFLIKSLCKKPRRQKNIFFFLRYIERVTAWYCHFLFLKVIHRI